MSIKVEHIERRSWMLSGIFLVASLPFSSFQVSMGVLLGALLAIINFRGLRRFVLLLVGTAPRPEWSKVLFFLYSLKYVLTGVVLFMAFKFDLAHPVSLMAGVSVIFLSICWEAIAVNLKPREGTNHA